MSLLFKKTADQIANTNQLLKYFTPPPKPSSTPITGPRRIHITKCHESHLLFSLSLSFLLSLCSFLPVASPLSFSVNLYFYLSFLSLCVSPLHLLFFLSLFISISLSFFLPSVSFCLSFYVSDWRLQCILSNEFEVRFCRKLYLIFSIKITIS